jgi:hypothetical protein
MIAPPKPDPRATPEDSRRATLRKIMDPSLGRAIGIAAADVTAGDPVMVSGMPGASGAVFTQEKIKNGKKVTATWTLGDTTSCQLLNPIDEEMLETFITDDKWVMQEKHDGKRMLLGYPGEGTVEAWNRKGQLIEPPEEFCSVLQKCFAGFQFVIDGEACGDKYWVFDILWLEGLDCRKLPYEERLVNLGMLIRSAKPQDVIRQVVTADTTMQKKSLVRAIKSAEREGVAIKDKECPYTAGRPNSFGPALKFKFVESASCAVIKVNAKRSVELGLYKPGVKLTDRDLSDSAREELSKHLTSVGNVTIPANHEIPNVGDAVEVQYLYAYKGGCLYQPVYKGRRDDVPVDTLDKLKYKPGEMPAGVVRGKFEDLTNEIVDALKAEEASKVEVAKVTLGLAKDKKYFKLDDGRLLKLLTLKQLSELPVGTPLVDVNGDPYTAGPELDDDTRGGFSGYGLLVPTVDEAKSLGAWGDEIAEIAETVERPGKAFVEFVESIVKEIRVGEVSPATSTESMAARMEKELRAKAERAPLPPRPDIIDSEFEDRY